MREEKTHKTWLKSRDVVECVVRSVSLVGVRSESSWKSPKLKSNFLEEVINSLDPAVKVCNSSNAKNCKRQWL